MQGLLELYLLVPSLDLGFESVGRLTVVARGNFAAGFAGGDHAAGLDGRVVVDVTSDNLVEYGALDLLLFFRKTLFIKRECSHLLFRWKFPGRLRVATKLR